MTYFTEEQVKLLLTRIHPHRVLVRDGMSYVEGYDIRAELTRIFGFGRWSSEVLDQALICETATKTSKGKDAWYVVYRSRVRLAIHAPDGTLVTFHDGSHVGESTHPVRGEAHGNALTNSETYALRRAAINLGDQFGLSLYNKGSMDALVRWTLVKPEAASQNGAARVDTDDVPQVAAEDSSSSATGSDGPQDSGDAFDNAEPAGTPQPSPGPADDQWQQPWPDWALEQALGLKDEKAATKLWKESADKVHKREITPADAERIQQVISARVEDLRIEAMERALTALPEDDEWRDKIRDLADADAARQALAEISGLTADRKMAPPRAGKLGHAIAVRWPNASKPERQAKAA